jgi:hypothetical protein
LPGRTDTDEPDHGALGTSGLVGYQLDGRVGDHYASVVAQGRDLQWPRAHSAALHRPIEAPPVQRPKDWRDDEIEASAERILRSMTDNLGYSITPLVDDAVAINGHGGALAIASPMGSVHTRITIRASRQFTTRLACAAVRVHASSRRKAQEKTFADS